MNVVLVRRSPNLPAVGGLGGQQQPRDRLRVDGHGRLGELADDRAAVLVLPGRAGEVVDELQAVGDERRARRDERPRRAVARVDLDAERVPDVEQLVARGHADVGGNLRRRGRPGGGGGSEGARDRDGGEGDGEEGESSHDRRDSRLANAAVNRDETPIFGPGYPRWFDDHRNSVAATDPRRLRGDHARHAAERARPDDRRHRAARDRRRPERLRRPQLGRHRLSAGRRRSRSRSTASSATSTGAGRLFVVSDHDLPGRLRAVRAGAEHRAS